MANPRNLVGLIVGAAVVFLFSGLAINAVSRSAGAVVMEVRRQFRELPGIMDGTQRPEYGKVVDICTRDAQRELMTPGLLAILAPIAVGFGLGPGALASYLAGAIGAGTLMAVFLANSGGAWDNAKKLVEDGAYGGKGSDVARRDGHRRHRRRPVQGHRRPGDQPADQGDEPGLAADRPGRGRAGAWATTRTPALRITIAAGRRADHRGGGGVQQAQGRSRWSDSGDRHRRRRGQHGAAAGAGQRLRAVTGRGSRSATPAGNRACGGSRRRNLTGGTFHRKAVRCFACVRAGRQPPESSRWSWPRSLLVVAGCGGPSPRAWAASVCEALTPWRAEINKLTSSTQQQMTAQTTPAQAKENLVRLFAGAEQASETARPQGRAGRRAGDRPRRGDLRRLPWPR